MQTSRKGRSPIRKLNLGSGLKSWVLIISAILTMTFLGCGGGGGTGGAKTYSIGGTVSGLSGTGLVLQSNGTNNSPVTTNGAFALNAPIAANSTYNVTVFTQPSSPAQVCVVSNGSGTATANITNIRVICTTTAYTIGGTVSGLTGTGLVLQDNGGDNLPVSGNGPFAFSQSIVQGNTYNVTVLTQPSNPTQVCTVNNGSGTANATVIDVQVLCSATIGGTVSGLAGTGLVVQNNGGNNLSISSNGTFTFTVPIAFGSSYLVTVLTQPSSPAQACIVLNASGTASGVNITNVQVNCSNKWTWQGGPSIPNQAGIYGTMGVASATNNPGARTGAVTWTDLSGNFWLYGGTGYDSAGTSNTLGDLWEYSGGEWTWMGGSKLVNQPVSYGTQGVAAPGNTPGARSAAGAWTDTAGNFWLFGGVGRFTGSGCNPVACSGEFNDLWEYSGGEWTWVGGPNTPFDAGTYGTLGVASAANNPPSRTPGATWVDATGNFWLLGGYSGLGNGSNPLGTFGDLWEYSAGEWTWVSGSNTVDQIPVYGTLGITAPANSPGARSAPFLWVDSSGNLWLFGGFGFDSTGAQGDLSDLWKYSAGEWTWMGGPNVHDQVGIYGTLGVPAASNIPGARGGGVSWVDSSGAFWLFGGSGQGATETFTESLGDVWEYNAGEWIWIGGFNAVFQPAVYETVGMPGDPGGRDGPASWIDKSGNVWIFGGSDQGTSAHPGYLLSDVWKYTP